MSSNSTRFFLNVQTRQSTGKKVSATRVATNQMFNHNSEEAAASVGGPEGAEEGRISLMNEQEQNASFQGIPCSSSQLQAPGPQCPHLQSFQPVPAPRVPPNSSPQTEQVCPPCSFPPPPCSSSKPILTRTPKEPGAPLPRFPPRTPSRSSSRTQPCPAAQTEGYPLGARGHYSPHKLQPLRRSPNVTPEPETFRSPYGPPSLPPQPPPRCGPHST